MSTAMPTVIAEAEVAAQRAAQRNWLEELAVNLAQHSVIVQGGWKYSPLPARLRILEAFLLSAHRYFERGSRDETGISSTAEWALDNFYIIEQALRQVGEDIPPDFYSRLPGVNLDGLETTRIYALASTLAKAQGSRLEMEHIMTFVGAFQSVTPLQIGETWALAPMLRLSILETLMDMLARITHLEFSSAPAIAWAEAPVDRRSQPRDNDPSVVVNCILSLRMLATQNWNDFFESVSVVESILRSDPAGIYFRMDFDTRNRYRGVIEELALGSHLGEVEIAREALNLSENAAQPQGYHIGYFLIDRGRPQLEARIGYIAPYKNRLRQWLTHHPIRIYLGGITLLTVALCLASVWYSLHVGGTVWQILLVLLLTLLPASAVAVDMVNWLVVQLMPPRVSPRLDFQNGIPSDCGTMVVVPSLLKNDAELNSLLRQVENHYLGNADPNVRFALLTDFIDAPQKELPGEADLLQQAKDGIERLNQRYGGDGVRPFYFFHRERIWNPNEGCWMGWERKRGKLVEFNSLVSGKERKGFIIRCGDLSFLPLVRYVVTLDADTTMPRDCVRQLVGILAHPLNRAEFDPETGVLVSGYTVIQPRVQVRPSVANRSIFTRIYSGDVTLDLYSRAVSDVYQDLFGEGSYIGKGIYDVAAFERCLMNRVPDNALLSHDLFEGIHGRCGLATNITLYEDYPTHYLAYVKRLHRWIRGDWQLLPWLMLQVPHRVAGKIPNSLSTLDRWKITDNLRRSLVTPFMLFLILAGWFFLPGHALVWTALALSPFVFSILFGLIAALRAPRAEYPETRSRPVQQTLLRTLFEIVFLPYQSLIIIDAIATTLVRLTITRKRLLQWVTAAHTVSLFGRDLKIKVARREMRFALAFSLLLIMLGVFFHPELLLISLPFVIIWALSPDIAVWISKPFPRAGERITPQQKNSLRQLARSTWLYFEKFVGPDDHWLPPDHFQEEPLGLVAHRTSPTNIGLLMLSTLSAWDLGYIGPQEMVLRVRNTLDSMDKLETQRGHLLNWYDTRTLAPLFPRYISTVDNGNLTACLVALRQGCRDIARQPVVRWDGLIDTLDVLDSVLHQANLGKNARELHDANSLLRRQAEKLHEEKECDPRLLHGLFQESRLELETLLAKSIESSAERLDVDTIHQISVWVERVRHHLAQIQRDIETFCPWSLTLLQTPSLFAQENLDPDLADAWDGLNACFVFKPPLEAIPSICAQSLAAIESLRRLLKDGEAISWCEAFAEQLKRARHESNILLYDLEAIRARAEVYVQGMNFNFLYNPQRKVFHIGYNVDTGRLDSSYYDLLASEARLTSLLAVAKGDVPLNHWLHLARPITQVGGMRALLSWSGTMFEYLMPALLSRHYPDTLLEQSCRAAVRYQISYVKGRGAPWGISESGFHFFDTNQAYQYRAFGVPGLGYKRGLGDDLVVTPYASLLALPFEPQAVLKNLEQFKRIDMLGLYGLYESADFTADRLGTGQDCAVVRSYMAHHQGMILLSLCNYLCNKSMIRRFHADPRIETVDLLLQEKTPIRAPVENPRPKEIGVVHPVHAALPLASWEVKPGVASPQVHFLSNGDYSLLIDSAGGGFARWHQVDLTRWRADSTLDEYGSWIYIKDRTTNQLWSAGLQPVAAQPASQTVRFYPHTVEFIRKDGDIATRMEIVIAPEVDVEIRRVTLTNHGESECDLELTSYAEVILSPQSADQRHPAYNKLFIESEFIPEGNILLFRRRPRSADEKSVYLAHFVVSEPVIASERKYFEIDGYETDRDRFIGRGNTQRGPAALMADSRLSNSTATLDPILALRARIIVPDYAAHQLAFVTLAAPSRREALELARRFNHWYRIRKTFDEARIKTEAELNQLELSSNQLESTQKLLSALLYPVMGMRADPSVIAANTLGQSGLWPFAISGDYPILLVRIKGDGGVDLLNDLFRAHTYWRRRGLMIDLVILNEQEDSYDQGFQGKIYRLLLPTNSDDWLGKRGGVFILKESQMAERERILIETTARVILDEDAGTLANQLQKLDRAPIRLPRVVPILPPLEVDDSSQAFDYPSDLLFDNGLGGFSPDGREYVICLDNGQQTPAPWVNVIANPEFGFLVSEAGMGCTWSINSGENKLTPWRNDPVCDPPSEAIYLRDEDTGQVWSPTPLPARADAPYIIRHGLGYTRFEHHSHHIRHEMKVFAVPDAPVKIVQLKLGNTTSRMRRINITYYAEWVLGATRENMAHYIVPEFESDRFALLAHNPYNQDFGERVAFLAATRELQGLTADRAEFLGPLGSYARPDALDRVGLTASVQAGADPCAAIQLLLWIPPHEEKEVTFLLGQGADRADALRLITHYQKLENVQFAWDSLQKFWDDHAGGVQIKTPDAAMDLLVNRWLPYQALSCRIWGRTAFYQSGGAFGYRDQLQDVLAFAYTRPEITRRHILDAARHQFEAGDVLHWWHPPADKGIRARITDNLLWLPYVTAQYIRATGDHSILDESIPFLAAEPLNDWEHERYGQFPIGETGTLYEHCRRALAKGTTAGKHGLPLMGAGDWNDGMNRVGAGGEGESVWLGWFLYATLMNFAKVGAEEDAASYREQAEQLRTALEASTWDGAWYRRAYYDNGKPLGSAENHDCQIDSISQSWAVISGAADPERARAAMESLNQLLVRRDDDLILLLKPPFDRTIHDPGYIKGYQPGIRENGGQYTHAAIWAIWAFAELGQCDRVVELFDLINPIHHSDLPDKSAHYRVEPYVIAADICSASSHAGRGGWTWYTGSASWMYRLVVEKIIGLQKEGNRLRFKPCLPKDWREVEVRYRFGATSYHIRIEVIEGKGSLSLDGRLLDLDYVPLVDDGGEHQVLVKMETKVT
ncbi:MAG: hypothetical protein HY865_24025 [Chloroflexi bacterium]|nr:hypothetical protein [Chloroflexota bacterium]